MATNEVDEPFEDGEVIVVDDENAGRRLDVVVNVMCKRHSRNHIKDLIKLGGVTVNGKPQKPSYSVSKGDRITICAEEPVDETLAPEAIPLDIVYEDATMLILNKPPGMPVHPGAGHHSGTLANALAYHFRELSDISGPQRPGIVHRLDRDTSGVICVAKTNRSHFAITSQFQDRTTEKVYYALVEGVMEFDEEISEGAIARHPHIIHKMVIHPEGRESLTRFKVVERFDHATLVACYPKTGRTHQIRVHLAGLGYPILCDHLYGRRRRITLGEISSMRPGDPADKVLLERQALHAHSLSLFHPLRGERVQFEVPIAPDIRAVIDAMRAHRRTGGTSR